MRSLVLCLVGAAVVWAQDAGDVVLRQTFQGDIGAWIAAGDTASLSPATESSGLVFSYDLDPKNYSGIVSPVPTNFAAMRRIRIHIRTDHATAMGLVLREKGPDGGDYSAWFWSPAHTWQWIELTPADFTVNDGPGDPKDADGKLDLSEVEAYGIFDLGQYFAKMQAAPTSPVTVRQETGRRTATLGSFEILSSPSSAESRGFLDWVTPGIPDLKLNSGSNPLHAAALEAHYQVVEGQFQLLLRRVSGAAVGQARHVAFDVASERDVTLMVSLEMNNPAGGQGPRFSLPIYPPGGQEVFHVNLDFDDLQGDGKFDPARWRTFSIADITAAGGGNVAPNTLWIGNVEIR